MRDVCLELQKKVHEVVYWRGYRRHFEEFSKDKKNFSDTVFADELSIQSDTLPSGVDVSGFPPPGKDIIEKLYKYGWIGLTMIERADLYNARVPRKKNVYYEYIKYWLGMIKKLRPDAVLFYTMPHSIDTYTLYSLACILNIKTVMLESSDIADRHILVNDYEVQSDKLRAYYYDIKDKNFSAEDLSADLKSYYLKQFETGVDKTPELIKAIRKILS